MLRKKGKKVGSQNYIIIFVRNSYPQSRLAISVSKKLGNAVSRNYEKRICREIFREIKNSLPSYFDLLIIVKRAVDRVSKRNKLDDSSGIFIKRKEELKRLFANIY